MLTNQVLVMRNIIDTHFVKKDEIIYVGVDRNYELIYLLYGRKILVSKTIKMTKNQLSVKHFFRAHVFSF
jgi:DNA-binding LytR/AlgR family response regulator